MLENRTILSTNLYGYELVLPDELGLFNLKEVCNLDDKECYGVCKVERSICVNQVAMITKNPEICNFAEVSSCSRDKCLQKLAFLTGDIAYCNMMNLHKLDIDKCYLNIVAEDIYFISTKIYSL